MVRGRNRCNDEGNPLDDKVDLIIRFKAKLAIHSEEGLKNDSTAHHLERNSHRNESHFYLNNQN